MAPLGDEQQLAGGGAALQPAVGVGRLRQHPAVERKNAELAVEEVRGGREPSHGGQQVYRVPPAGL